MYNLNELSFQQQRFCDEYLVSFNAFRAALAAGYTQNTARKAEMLHMPKIQAYLKAGMEKNRQRLEVTHDMILRELAKVAFSNMGNYYDERGAIKPMCYMSTDEKAAISYYQISDRLDSQGYRVGEFGKIKLHNKMAALDKIARHTGFYVAKPQATSLQPQAIDDGQGAASDEKVAVVEQGVKPEPQKGRILFVEQDADCREQRAALGIEEPGVDAFSAFENAAGADVTLVPAEVADANDGLAVAALTGDADVLKGADMASDTDGSGGGKILTLSPLADRGIVIDAGKEIPIVTMAEVLTRRLNREQ